MTDDKVKVISFYLPQFHITKENNDFWGEGFTDWVSVKGAEPLFGEHRQPNVPKDENYYDLSKKDAIAWQIELANEYGIYGFGMYHYWFKDGRSLLTKPAEIILANEDLDIPFMFIWDNNSWKRTWSKLDGGSWAPKIDATIVSNKTQPEMLVEYQLGDEHDWKEHFEYLLKFFKDKRYIKNNNKPFIGIYTYSYNIDRMVEYWDKLSVESGFDGVEVIFRYDWKAHVPQNYNTYVYEPLYSGWGSHYQRLVRHYIIKNKLKIYSYDEVWRNIIKNAKKLDRANCYLGGFVNYDDTPRRGHKGTLIKNGTPEKFNKYINQLLNISKHRSNDYLFLTAWNEWGEGAYLEPDELNEFRYLEELRKSLIATNNMRSK